MEPGVVKMNENVLIVDDEKALGTDLAAALSSAGNVTRHRTNVPEARQAWSEEKADLCLVDILMPGPSGKVFCREISEHSDASNIMMSSLGDHETAIALLDIGADDCIVKPFSMSEMMARVRAVLRRRTSRSAPQAASSIEIGDLAFDLQLRRLSKPEGLTIPLSSASTISLRDRGSSKLLRVASRRLPG
ncbi:response regulator transcription factor [Leisingera sp. NJS204]|nr:response regulator transcription factor [Leisingera sp. NJS204]